MGKGVPEILTFRKYHIFALRGQQCTLIEVKIGVVQYSIVHFCMPNLAMIGKEGGSVCESHAVFRLFFARQW